MKYCISADVFLSLNSPDEPLRIAVKNFFIRNFNQHFLMSYEQIGLVDNIIWKYKEELQFQYFAFMDILQTRGNFFRYPFTSNTFFFLKKYSSQYLNFSNKMNLAFAREHQAKLILINDPMLAYPQVKTNYEWCTTKTQKELSFPEEIEQYYQKALVLKTTFIAI